MALGVNRDSLRSGRRREMGVSRTDSPSQRLTGDATPGQPTRESAEVELAAAGTHRAELWSLGGGFCVVSQGPAQHPEILEGGCQS